MFVKSRSSSWNRMLTWLFSGRQSTRRGGNLPEGICKFRLDPSVRWAGLQTAWRLTHLSRRRYFLPVPPDRANGEVRPSYKMIREPTQAEPNSDIRAVMVDKMISVTPLSLDLTSRIDLSTAHHPLRADQALDSDEIFATSRPSSDGDGRSGLSVDWIASHSCWNRT